MSGYEFVPVLERASINDYVRLFAEVYGLTEAAVGVSEMALC